MLTFISGMRVVVVRVWIFGGKFNAAIAAVFPASPRNVKGIDLAKMSVDELWALHENLREILATKLDAKMHEMQRRMAEIDAKPRRPYPKVMPKYRNPQRSSETWSGRGLQPHWVRAQLRKGKKLDDLLISRAH